MRRRQIILWAHQTYCDHYSSAQTIDRRGDLQLIKEKITTLQVEIDAHNKAVQRDCEMLARLEEMMKNTTRINVEEKG